jgi:hypothetical protein
MARKKIRRAAVPGNLGRNPLNRKATAGMSKRRSPARLGREMSGELPLRYTLSRFKRNPAPVDNGVD